jgi:16S rRNA (guanine527-N7)-methyltransferase
VTEIDEDADPARAAEEILDRGLGELDLSVERGQRDALLELARLLDRWGERINLTGHRGLPAIVRNLVLDAAALVAQLPEIASLADLGSGAGFPGLPVAILRPSCRVTLVEARLKRHHFQREACRSLGIANATPLHGRAEELEPSPHAAAVAQAMARPEVAVAVMASWLAPGGIAILPGGPVPARVEHPRMIYERVVHYRVPCRGIDRTLWIGRVIEPLR